MNFRRIILLFLLCLISTFISAQNIYFVADTTVGCDSLRVTFSFVNTIVPDTVSTVTWDFGNGQTGTGKEDQTILYDTSGYYCISIVVNNNTVITQQNYIAVYPTPDPHFHYTDTLDLGSYTVVLWNVNQVVDTISYSYLWEFENDETAYTRKVIHTFPSESSWPVRLTVTNPLGCAATWTGNVEVFDILKYPNVFTPNDDNMNDYFQVVTNGRTVYSLRVYSRSGMLVYRTESPIIIWDGRNQSGQELPPDIYFFTIKSVDGTGSPATNGFVHLFRDMKK
jgi:gliding motility-associated-like protein